jgi:serine protease Do
VPRLPDWLIYLTVIAALLAVALGGRQTADAPPAPPPPPGAADMPLPGASPFAAARLIPIRRRAATGAALSLDAGGVWATSRRALCGGRPLAIVVAEGRGVAAEVKAVSGDVAILTTAGGAPAVALSANAPREGELGFAAGFLGKYPGEAALQFLDQRPARPGREGAKAPLQAWAEAGRTEDSTGPISDLAGAPILDPQGQVVGLVVGGSPGRGRLYAAGADALVAALSAVKLRPEPGAPTEPPAVDNYGRIADGLRRDLTVAEVACRPA